MHAVHAPASSSLYVKGLEPTDFQPFLRGDFERKLYTKLRKTVRNANGKMNKTKNTKYNGWKRSLPF